MKIAWRAFDIELPAAVRRAFFLLSAVLAALAGSHFLTMIHSRKALVTHLVMPLLTLL